MNKIKIVERLDKAKFYQMLVPSLRINGKPEALGLCPFHDDRDPSLSVNVETGLFKCFACGAGGDVFAFYQRLKKVGFPTALREIGEMAGVINTNVKPKVVATFEYKNKNGDVLYIKERIEPGRNGRSKGFVFKHLENGKWTLGRGCDPVLYNLPGVMKSKNVIVLEGEGKADLLNAWGLVATCLDSGANSPLKGGYIQILAGMESVVILPDNDKPGQAYAVKIANALKDKVGNLKIVNIPGLQAKEDVINWAKIPGNTSEKLLAIIKNAPEWTPIEKSLLKVSTIQDMLQYEPPKFFVEPFLYKKTVNLFTALAGIGKSLTALSIAVAIASNRPLWGHFQPQKTGNVLIVDEENPGSILRSRIDRMCNNKETPVHFIHYQNFKIDNLKYFNELVALINREKYVLVIFDALIRFHSAKENDADEMAKVMGAFRGLIKQTDTTVLIIHHERKSRDGERRERSRGSGDIVGAVDCQFVLEEEGEIETGKELILYPGKMRLASFTPIKLTFNTDTLQITYSGKVLSSKKSITQSIVRFIGNSTKDFEEIQSGTGIQEKQLRIILKNALSKELILDSTIKQKPGYTGSRKKLFYKVRPGYLDMFPPIGGETYQIGDTQQNIPIGDCHVQTRVNAVCGDVAEHGLPHAKYQKSMWQGGQKKSHPCHIENSSKTEEEIEIPEVDFVEEIFHV